MDNVREDLKEKHIDLTRIGEATRNREVWRSLVSTLMEVRNEEKEDSIIELIELIDAGRNLRVPFLLFYRVSY